MLKVVPLRIRIRVWVDRALAVLLALILVGSALAFGGVVWWWRPLAAVLATGLVGLGLVRVALEGRLRLWASPLPLLGLMLLALGAAQLAPLPGRLGQMASPNARFLHASGVLPTRALADDPAASLPEAIGTRSPLTVDRAATLRWLFDACLALIVFVSASRFADRLSRLALIWGAIVAIFGINLALGLVELLGESRGFYGFIQPGRGPAWAPSSLQLLQAPGSTELRPLFPPDGSLSPWVISQVRAFPVLGTLPGGGGALLALASLGLPLAMAALLHLLAPRGSREPLWDRLSSNFQLGLAGLLLLILLAGSAVVGVLAGPLLGCVYGLALLLIALPSARPTGLRWTALAVTAPVLLSLALGIAGNGYLLRSGVDGPWKTESDWLKARQVWTDGARIFRDFPLVGTGLGTFGSIYPEYKTQDGASTTARSSLLQFAVEAGLAGVLLAALGVLWGLARLWPSWRQVGTADRSLAWGLIGTALCFATFVAVHWSIEIPAVALAAAAWAGTLDRWLAGGTDLFVDAYA